MVNCCKKRQNSKVYQKSQFETWKTPKGAIEKIRNA